jgi:hypothetical protein
MKKSFSGDSLAIYLLFELPDVVYLAPGHSLRSDPDMTTQHLLSRKEWAGSTSFINSSSMLNPLYLGLWISVMDTCRSIYSNSRLVRLASCQAVAFTTLLKQSRLQNVSVLVIIETPCSSPGVCSDGVTSRYRLCLRHSTCSGTRERPLLQWHASPSLQRITPVSFQ